jgi:restriction system protein
MRAFQAGEREQLRQDKTRAKEYAEARVAEALEQTNEVEAQVEEIAGLLAAFLNINSGVDLQSLKTSPPSMPFDPGPLGVAGSAPSEGEYLPKELGFMQRAIPGAQGRHAQALSEGKARYAAARAEWQSQEAQRIASLGQLQTAHQTAVDTALREHAAHNSEVDLLIQGFGSKDPSAVSQYFSLVLDRSPYPPTFPRAHKVAYVPESTQLVVELELPEFDIVPEDKLFRYVKTKDEIEPSPRPMTQRKLLYASLVGQITLATLHALFTADDTGCIETVVLNGYVNAVNPRTGQPGTYYLVTVRVTREVFESLDLSQVEPLSCLTGLNAGVSRSPSDLEPVRPVLNFSMVDPRFVEESDVLSTLDQRPNLMDLSPKEFENLITNLFTKMGLETRQTQASRDGGVDCVAFDNRPIFGGKVVIQAKRYKNTVGVSAVRDLFGTVQNEGASKGILVTTSGYGGASYEFASGKPLELLDGANLLSLLADYTGVEARIQVPEEWVDPVPDMGA